MLQGCAAASREPQALRPEGAIVVMSHLLCRTANSQSLAAGPHGLTSLELHGQRPRVDAVTAGAAQQPCPLPNLLGQPDPGDAVACPADRGRRVVAKDGSYSPVAHGHEERRLDLALAGPLGEQRPAVGRCDDAPPPADPARQAPPKDDPARVSPSIERRALPRGLENRAGPESKRGMRAVQDRRMCRARGRRVVARAATSDDEERCQQDRNAHDPEYRAAA